MKTRHLIAFILSILSSSQAKPETRVLACEYSMVKKEYVLTEEGLRKSNSHKSKFANSELSILVFMKKAEKHLNEVQIPAIAPHVKWPPDDYNKNIKLPIDTKDLEFAGMELCKHGEFLYWKVKFLLSDQLAATKFPVTVAMYLNGEVPNLVNAVE